MARWRRPEQVLEVLSLGEAGLPHGEISARTGVPLNTVRLWLHGRIPRSAKAILGGGGICPKCNKDEHDFRTLCSDHYSYVLGLYLGDGCVSIAPKAKTASLRITLDNAYPWIISSASDAIEELRGKRPYPARTYDGRNCTTLVSYGKDWPCWLPQHGPGRKHHRPIVLAPWQQEIVDARPEPFLRGLIHSDGWRGMNRVTSKGKDYEYPRYQFSNRSADIKRLFTDTCEKLGVEWRPWGRWHISVAKRESVAILDSFIGPKC